MNRAILARWARHLPALLYSRDCAAFLSFVPLGHYYSPIPSSKDIRKHRERLFDRSALQVPGVCTDLSEQIILLQSFAEFHQDWPFSEKPKQGLLFYDRNDYCENGDSFVLYSMLRRHKPQRVIEVGSGFSSALMLDTNELFLSSKTKFTFVEPNPNRLYGLLRKEDYASCAVIREPVQNVPLVPFQDLGAGDILFIDSSHVARIGSDVVHMLTHVLPALQKGVLVHIHDIPWPFEYPEAWLKGGRAWNEAYMVKAFLQYNAAFKIRS